MEQRSSISKWLFLGLAVLLFIQFGLPAITGSGKDDRQPLADVQDSFAPAERPPAQTCEIQGDRFVAHLSSRGASLTGYELTQRDRYYEKVEMPEGVFAGIAATFSKAFGKPTGPLDLVTTTDASRMPLRTDLRIPGAQDQLVAYNDLDFKLASQDGKSCTFVYEERKVDRLRAALAAEKDEAKQADLKKQIEDASKEEPPVARVTKTITATGNPYELAVDVKVENLGAEPRKVRLAIEQTAWRTQKETAGSLGRQSDWMTETIASGAKTERQAPTDFEPGDFKDKEFTPEKWRRTEGAGKWASVGSTYMAGIVLDAEGGETPTAETQIEERWNPAFADKHKDPQYGHVYRARLAYPEKELKPGEAESYKVVSFYGPKERDLLEKLGHGTPEVINLGMFSFIGKALIWYLYKLKWLVGSWGWAICLMTITVRTLLFPLSITQIKSTVVMRRLKPEIDELNEKYKDNTTQKGLALQELYRKHGVNPVIGCLPMLLQMPVWFALYSALQTAVELYNVPFGPFIPDLSSPGKYFIIPAVLGVSSFIQQKIMPMQGDPAQQKMMLYMMPAVFTIMMLFLPAGLGVYMLTNTWLGIGQQLLVEKYLKSRAGAPPTGIVVKEKTGEGGKTKGDKESGRHLLERGKARG